MTSAIVERSPLARIAKLIESVAKANHPVSTCQNVRVKIADNRIELFANDLDKSLRMWVPAETPKPGTSFLVPAARLSSFLNGAVGSDAKLSWTKAALTVNIGAARSVLQTLPASDLPELEGDAGEGAALSADLLRTVCKFCADAVGMDKSRFYLEGVFFDASGPEAIAVSTNGMELAALPLGVRFPQQGMPVHAAALSCLAASCSGDMQFALNDLKLRATWGDGEFVSKVIDCTFPDWRRAVPAEYTVTANCSARDIIAALDRLSRSSGCDKVGFIIEGHTAHLRAWDGTDKPDVTDEIEAETSGPIQIGFIAAQLADAAKATLISGSGDRLEMSLDPNGGACRFRTRADAEYRVVMPYRVVYFPEAPAQQVAA